MTAQAILTELQGRGVRLYLDGAAIRYRAPKGALTPELRQKLATHKAAVLAALSESNVANTVQSGLGDLEGRPNLAAAGTRGAEGVSVDGGTIAAVKLVNTVIGDLWLVADSEALIEHSDIIRSGLPVFFFDEVENLRDKTPTELKAIGMVKATFPSSRVLQ